MYRCHSNARLARVNLASSSVPASAHVFVQTAALLWLAPCAQRGSACQM
jgi:hypothetical protein